MSVLINEVKEIYRSKNFLRAMVFKNLFGRYKSSVFGFAWHFFTPLIMLGVYYLAFSYARHSDIPDNWLFIASGIFVFHFLMVNIIQGSGVIVNQGEMVKKIYFPRAILPLANVISTFIICLIGYLLVFVCILITGHSMNLIALLTFLIAMILAFIFSTGCILLTSSITVFVRDLHFLLSSISMVFFFMTPMYFIASETTGTFNTIIWCNPLTYFVEMCHDSLYRGVVSETRIFVIAVLMSIAVFIAGVLVFHKLENRFAEKL